MNYLRNLEEMRNRETKGNLEEPVEENDEVKQSNQKESDA